MTTFQQLPSGSCWLSLGNMLFRFPLFFILVFGPLSLLGAPLPLDLSASVIEWRGQKSFVDTEHRGTVKIKKAYAVISADQKLIGGTVVIDMTTLENQDLTGIWKKKLETHLHSADFFDTTKFPEAIFKITDVEYTRSDLINLIGLLTVRDTSRKMNFPVKLQRSNNRWSITGEVTFDRTHFGIHYHSNQWNLKQAKKIMKDEIIKDQVTLMLQLQTL